MNLNHDSKTPFWKSLYLLAENHRGPSLIVNYFKVQYTQCWSASRAVSWWASQARAGAEMLMTPATNAFSPQQIPTTNSIGNTLIRQIGDVQEIDMRRPCLAWVWTASALLRSWWASRLRRYTTRWQYRYTGTYTQIQVHSWCQQPTQIHNKVTIQIRIYTDTDTQLVSSLRRYTTRWQWSTFWSSVFPRMENHFCPTLRTLHANYYCYMK